MEDQGDVTLQSIKGIGPRKIGKLHRLGIVTIRDMLTYYPRDHERWEWTPFIRDIAGDGNIIVKGFFSGVARTQRIRKNLTITRWRLCDETGAVECVWYNQPYRAKQYESDTEYVVMGAARTKPRRQIMNPRIAPIGGVHAGTQYLPVYPASDGITQNDLRTLAKAAMGVLDRTQETLPASIRDAYQLMDIREALRQIHFPRGEDTLTRAKQRIVFEEFFWYQLALAYLRSHRQDRVTGPNCPLEDADVEAFIAAMPFPLTGAQERTIGEIKDDLARAYPMNRLVHGDVGSGKTVIAAFCLYAAWKSGYQGAMMAPTEVLARQLAGVLARLLAPFGIRVAALTGSQTAQEKMRIKEAIAAGEIDIAAGTHALIQEDVAFQNLGMVVTDEQHRFGVRQRTALKAKGGGAHMMVMSATPIPRTMALLLFGDLDVSTLDELPAGRKPIRTDFVDKQYRQRIFRFIRDRVNAGERAYIICPLVADSDALEAEAAVSYYQMLTEGPLSDIRIGLLHGRMKAAEKESVMRDFANGETTVLVSTTVVEVGVDVPQATVMVIENAERFGLAQLHQLRGRVGRSAAQSYCILISDTENDETRRRLTFLCKTNDGFAISEEDLSMRGPGDFFGTRQHGTPVFRLADPVRNMQSLKDAAQAAWDTVNGKEDPAPVIEEALSRMLAREKNISMN